MLIRDRGVGGRGEGGGGHVPPPPIFLKLKKISKEKCLVPRPNIEALMVPPNLKVAPLLFDPIAASAVIPPTHPPSPPPLTFRRQLRKHL